MHDLHTICALLLTFLTNVSTNLHAVLLFESFTCTICALIPRPVHIPTVICVWLRTYLFLICLHERRSSHYVYVCAVIHRRVPSTHAYRMADHFCIILHITTLATSMRFGLRWSQYVTRLALVCGNKFICSLWSHVYYPRSESGRPSPLVWESSRHILKNRHALACLDFREWNLLYEAAHMRY